MWYHKKATGFISTLFIREEFRGRGYAELLEAAAFEFFSSRNCFVAHLNVDEINWRGQNYYKKSGWLSVGPGIFPNSRCFEKVVNLPHQKT